jgi:hypothetical protein
MDDRPPARDGTTSTKTEPGSAAASPPRAGSPARQRYVEEIWAEQEAKNAELHKIDHSHVPPLRVADRYTHGRRKRK